ncbi:unnamed protein product [Caenorhabditis bovis]|uniref:Carboxylic ester hydrolase n=1 Tax=Caenorhabditis bovis TaxID=2654633 RepID=A0A8S1FBU8_9PELO|nr:unnamed protein product [Caenorhabditis bovis]
MGISSSKLEHSAIMNATCGPVRGISYNIDGKFVNGFLGIPYAKPPIGELRFKKPVAHEVWTEPRDCFRFGLRAPQNDELIGQFMNHVGKSEAHCLNLNVFAPSWHSPSGFPVMVFIHGGGFAVHSSSNYGSVSVARNLCVKDVVVVTINYRLGLLGFMSTGDDVCRGNLGLWDQTMALEWVRDHIRCFGGDPTNVTIFGQSAGGASVDLLCLSPHSRDLFQRAIPMAGNGECYFAVRTAEQQAALTKEYARYLGWKDDDTVDLMRFFNAEPLYKLEMGLNPKRGFRHSQQGNLYFVPNFDGEFFPRPLDELRKEAPKKSLMTGTTKYEGLFFVGLGAISRTHDGFKRFARQIFKPCDYGGHADEIQRMVYDYYMKGVNPKNSHQMAHQIVKFLGDYSINYGTYRLAKSMSDYGNTVYFYSFEHFNPHGFGVFKWMLPFLGATHCTELRYVLGKGVISKFRPDERDKAMIETMTTFFTNFAKYGDPNPPGTQQWLPHDPNEPFKHFKIDFDNCAMHDDYQDRRLLFWDEIHAKNRYPLATLSSLLSFFFVFQRVVVIKVYWI